MDNFNGFIHHSLHLYPQSLYIHSIRLAFIGTLKTTSDNICFHKLIHHLINFVAMNKQKYETSKNRSNYDEAAKMIVYCVEERFIQINSTRVAHE